ncbi:MAG: hypothetical protein V4714_19890 [Bacteroidota bacterium]
MDIHISKPALLNLVKQFPFASYELDLRKEETFVTLYSSNESLRYEIVGVLSQHDISELQKYLEQYRQPWNRRSY